MKTCRECLGPVDGLGLSLYMRAGEVLSDPAVAPVETREEKEHDECCELKLGKASCDCGLDLAAPLPEALEAGAQTVIDDLFARGMEASDLAVALQRHLNAAEDALEAVEQEIERALDSLDKNCFGVDMREKYQSMNPVIDTVVRQSDVLHDLLTIRKAVKAIREHKNDQARVDGPS